MQVLFDFSKQQITIEGEELELVELLKLVREIAPKIPAINIKAQGSQVSDDPSPPLGAPPARNGSGTTQTMRQFVRSIDLTSMSQKIAAIAYYQKHYGANPTFTPKDMGGFFTHCGFQRPAQMPVALFDAKRKYGYVESSGHGMYRVSTQGENLIVGKIEAKPEQNGH
jgi:hypothetical protein